MKLISSLLLFGLSFSCLLGCAAAQSAPVRAHTSGPEEARLAAAPKAPQARPQPPREAPRLETAQASRVQARPQGAPVEALPQRPDRQALLEGFAHISRSTQQCLERYKKRHPRAPVETLRVEIQVQRDGSVSQLQVDRVVRETSFGRCLQAHSSRWRFAPFTGEPIQVARNFQLK